MGTIKSKMILISLLVLISLFTGCTFTFVTSSVGELIIENEVLAVDQNGNLLNDYDEDFPIRAIVAYKDGEEYYRMDGVYKNVECNIPAGEYCTYQWDSGTYDILLYSYYNDYWYSIALSQSPWWYAISPSQNRLNALYLGLTPIFCDSSSADCAFS